VTTASVFDQAFPIKLRLGGPKNSHCVRDPSERRMRTPSPAVHTDMQEHLRGTRGERRYPRYRHPNCVTPNGFLMRRNVILGKEVPVEI